jgi:hypothetical protein
MKFHDTLPLRWTVTKFGPRETVYSGSVRAIASIPVASRCSASWQACSVGYADRGSKGWAGTSIEGAVRYHNTHAH